MATASDHVLVLGQWHDGFYPIEWRRTEHKEHKAREEWRVFGIKTAVPLDREDCERILGAIAKGTT
jgi:hypothetical protein